MGFHIYFDIIPHFFKAGSAAWVERPVGGRRPENPARGGWDDVVLARGWPGELRCWRSRLMARTRGQPRAVDLERHGGIPAITPGSARLPAAVAPPGHRQPVGKSRPPRPTGRGCPGGRAKTGPAYTESSTALQGLCQVAQVFGTLNL